MKFGRYTIAIFLIFSGILLLMENFGWLRAYTLRQLVRYWPVILILLGLEVLLESRFLWVVIFLILFFVGFFAVVIVRLYLIPS